MSTLQQCAPRNCHPRRTPLTIAGFVRGTGTLKDSLAPARERGARLLASVAVGKAPRDFFVGRFLDALHKEAGGVSVLQHSSVAAPVSPT